MSDSIAVMQELFRLFSEGQAERTFDMVSDDFEMFEPGPKGILPWGGTYNGRDGFIAFNQALKESLSEIRIDNVAFEDIGEGRVLMRGLETGVSAATGRSYVTDSVWIWTVRDGKVAAMRAWHDTHAMAEAFRTD